MSINVKETSDFEIEDLGEQEETVYDIEVEDYHNFFGNGVLLHNSRYFTIEPILKKEGIDFFNSDGSISKRVYEVSEDIAGYVDREIMNWHRDRWNCKNPAVGFKREALSDSGVFIAKKMYALHVLDDEEVLCDKITYHGLAVVRSSTPQSLKPMIKDLIETLIKTQNRQLVLEKANRYWDEYQKMPVMEKVVSIGLNNVAKYMKKATRDKNGSIVPAKGTPRQVVAAFMYNDLLSREGLSDKYEKLVEGDKEKIMYVLPNRFGITSFAFKNKIPKEWENDIIIDDVTMFKKTVLSCLEKIYETIGWIVPDVTKNEEVDLVSLLS